jgi:proline racemase
MGAVRTQAEAERLTTRQETIYASRTNGPGRRRPACGEPVQAWITGTANYTLQENGPFPEGYTVGDIW